MELVPAGYYAAVGVPNEQGEWCQFGQSSTGNDQVLMNFEIIEGPYAGRRLPWWGSFSQKAAKRTIESLRLTGFKGEDLSDAPAQQLNQRVSITVEHKKDQNDPSKVFARVAWVNRSGGGGVSMTNAYDAGNRQRFAAKMKALVRGIPEAAGEKAAPGNAQPAPSQDPNDTVPF